MLCVVEGRVLRKIFGRKREEVTENKEFRVSVTTQIYSYYLINHLDTSAAVL
jgi:hypothetical protein